MPVRSTTSKTAKSAYTFEGTPEKKPVKKSKNIVEDDENTDPNPRASKKTKAPTKPQIHTIEESDEEPLVAKRTAGKAKRIVDSDDDEAGVVEEKQSTKKNTKKRTTEETKATTSKKSKVPAEEPEEEEEMPKTKKSVANNGKSAVSSSAATVSVEEYNKLKARFEELKELRETGPERQYRESMKNAEEREAAANKMISQLKLEVERLKKEGTNSNNAKNSSKLLREIEMLRSQVSELELEREKNEENKQNTAKMLAFYQELSSIRITSLGDNKYECECTHSTQPTRSVRFELDVTSAEIEYYPINTSQAASFLPAFLKDTICFKSEELPAFLHKILTAVYKR